jgi:formate hydrogenlyase transcriptional activator
MTSAAAEGKFRQDLFYRLSVFPIRLPASRERISDIFLLVGYLIDCYAQKVGKKMRNIDANTMELFDAYDWPGNIRELQNVVERAVILSEGEIFFVDEAWLTRATPRLAAASVLATDLAEREKALVENALREADGLFSGRAGAAAKLGVPQEIRNQPASFQDLVVSHFGLRGFFISLPTWATSRCAGADKHRC